MKNTTKIKVSESDVQSSIIDYLTILEKQGKIVFWRANNIPAVYEKDGRRMFRKMPKGSKNGVPDINVIVKRGTYLGIEVKSPSGGRLSEEQKEMRDKIQKVEGLYVMVISLDEVIGLMDTIMNGV